MDPQKRMLTPVLNERADCCAPSDCPSTYPARRSPHTNFSYSRSFLSQYDLSRRSEFALVINTCRTVHPLFADPCWRPLRGIPPPSSGRSAIPSHTLSSASLYTHTQRLGDPLAHISSFKESSHPADVFKLLLRPLAGTITSSRVKHV